MFWNVIKAGDNHWRIPSLMNHFSVLQMWAACFWPMVWFDVTNLHSHTTKSLYKMEKCKPSLFMLMLLHELFLIYLLLQKYIYFSDFAFSLTGKKTTFTCSFFSVKTCLWMWKVFQMHSYRSPLLIRSIWHIMNVLHIQYRTCNTCDNALDYPHINTKL